MKVYIINLKRCPERKVYMNQILSQYTFLDIEFIEAVDGSLLTKKELLFNQDKAFRIYGRTLSDGEIGCTLSHQLCYRKIKDNNDEYALILEDDLFISDPKAINVLEDIEKICNTSKPEIILLSGDYWWTRKSKIDNVYSIASVFDASCTHSYIINKRAAIAQIVDVPYFIADDWLLFKRRIVLKALHPHLIDQNRDDFKTEVHASNIGIVRRKLSFKRNLYYYIIAIIKRLLNIIHHFEYKNFKNGRL